MGVAGGGASPSGANLGNIAVQAAAAMAPAIGGAIAGPAGAMAGTAVNAVVRAVASNRQNSRQSTPPATPAVPVAAPTGSVPATDVVEPVTRAIIINDIPTSMGYRQSPPSVTTNYYKTLQSVALEWTWGDYIESLILNPAYWVYLLAMPCFWFAIPIPWFWLKVQLVLLVVWTVLRWARMWIRRRRPLEGAELMQEGALIPSRPYAPTPAWIDESRDQLVVPSELLGHLMVHATFTDRSVKVAQELKMKAKAWLDKTQMTELEKAAVIPLAVASAMVPSKAELAAHFYMGGAVANTNIWAANRFTTSGQLAGGGTIPTK